MSTYIDLNADVGELPADCNQDAELMPWLSSCNIACAAHAGSEQLMRTTVQLAKHYGVQIGAHPGYADRANMGRVAMQLDEITLRTLILAQLSLLARICVEEGVPLCHVKTHGALYNQSARDVRMALIISQAIRDFSPKLIVVGQAGSEHIKAASSCGLVVMEEVFADRRYEDDGSLTPRKHAQAHIENEREALQQVLGLAKESRVKSREGQWLKLHADTVCLHGDSPHAVTFARLLREELALQQIEVRAFVGRQQ